MSFRAGCGSGLDWPALATEPDVLTLDEPFGALDAMTREVMPAEFDKILSRTNQTVIFITHSIDEAIAMGDRIVVMTAGPGRIKAILDVNIPRPRYGVNINMEDMFNIMRSRDYEIPDVFVEQYPRAISILGEDGYFTADTMETMLADAVKTGSLEGEVDWRDFVDLSYLNQAYEELGMADRIREP